MQSVEKIEIAIDELQSLIRGEKSAHQTYGQAIESVTSRKETERLSQIQSEHREALVMLRDECRQLGGEVDLDSGLWGDFSQAVVGTAKALGTAATLKALKEGEEHGKKDFEDALQKESVPDSAKEIIQETLIPNQKRHILELEKLIQAA